MGCNKMLMMVAGKTPLEWCMHAAEKSCADEIVFAVSPQTEEYARSLNCKKPVKIVMGGNTRGQSVYNALKACKEGIVAIHDGARCAVTPTIIDRCIADAEKYGNAQAANPVRDTVRNSQSNICVKRDELYAMQTPQVFERDVIIAAYEKAGTDTNTDDCGVFVACGGVPHYTVCDITNRKLTSPDDIIFFERMLGNRTNMRIGYGEDTHRLSEGRKLILGGESIDFYLGLLGHSDADALCHAISDALLGACALGDIGQHFPDTDSKYKDADSIELLRCVADKVRAEGFTIGNIDSTIVAQAPKLAPHIDNMRKNISRAINVDISRVSVKATTPEHTNAEGNMECITVRAIAMVYEV